MTDPVRRCPDHGYADGACPCGAVGDPVISADRRTRLSKFLSGALRHFPADVGLSLDESGWVGWASLVTAATDRYSWADADAVAGVVATDPKGRFERVSGPTDRVRAAYGHSVDVTLDGTDDPVPATLYHGTAPRNVDSIREAGLKPMSRQTVHLSESAATAREVGRRHAADPVVFVVDATAMQSDDRRIVKRGTETYTTDRVSPVYLSLLEK
mgnify:CR=1 FL=1